MKKSFLFMAAMICLLHLSAQNWSEVTKIQHIDLEAGDEFGTAISISGSYAIIGVYQEEDDLAGASPLYRAGSAYIFEKDVNGTWNQKQKLIASDRAEEDYFGFSVSISGDYALVSSLRKDGTGIGGNKLEDIGTVYIYERSENGTWNELQKITAFDKAAKDQFGAKTVIYEDMILVGVPLQAKDSSGQDSLSRAGAVYIFERDENGLWNFLQKIVASDRDEADAFGLGLAFDGVSIVVGAAFDEDSIGGSIAIQTGSIYIFEKDSSGSWNEKQKIVASDQGEFDRFGNKVSIDDGYLIVGSDNNKTDISGGNPITAAGAAYLFEKDSNGIWQEVQKIVAPNRTTFDLFGGSVSISNDIAVVGSSGKEYISGTDTINGVGSAYIFQRDDSGKWNQVQKLISSDKNETNFFGFPLSIDDSLIFIGSTGVDETQPGGSVWKSVGAAYIFELSTASSITKNDFGTSLKIFPNPTKENITIELGENHPEVLISIKNLVGQTLFTQSVSHTDKIDVKIEGPVGLYFIEIRTLDGKSAIAKVLKE